VCVSLRGGSYWLNSEHCSRGARAGSGGIARSSLQVFRDRLFLDKGSFRLSQGVGMTEGKS